jgi:hypothetical protein
MEPSIGRNLQPTIRLPVNVSKDTMDHCGEGVDSCLFEQTLFIHI